MKTLTFRKQSNGRYSTYHYFNDMYQDKPTYLDELTQGNSLIFKCLNSFEYFKCKIGNMIVIGHTDKYGNKILQIR